jgi:hypothetical protein
MLKVLPLPFLPLPWHQEPSLVFSSEMRKQIVRIRQKLYFKMINGHDAGIILS